ncbi:hypothetical protein EXE58_06320 [Nocardioides seonyuensis]|uniref:DUF485 domain-containing protein n=1 Tax=Nocardioides seonyuensis TaxID=2518371 RepID=A0A4P7ID93_9ACTN|nr:hypothetical protein [Nocardioides seonyuensis]QBX55109.1 hypothetical protein EXE58_06320 [Nocardioides seonyuensis]
MSDSGPPPRVRVTGPPRRRALASRHAGAREIDSETALGEVFMRSLLREQLRLAAAALVALALTLGVLPLVFHLAPDLADVRVLGVPVSWVVLGVLAYPWMVFLGWVYVRRAEANESDFAALLDAAGDAGEGRERP